MVLEGVEGSKKAKYVLRQNYHLILCELDEENNVYPAVPRTHD